MLLVKIVTRIRSLVNQKRLFSLILWAGLVLTGCSRAVLINPQLPSGGINSTAPDEYPAYSGDGRYLAFASDRNGRREIFLYDLQQRRLVVLPNLNQPNASQDQPSLSADGRFLAYVSTARGKTDIMVYDRDRQSSELLSANVRGSVAHPTISGDGKRVAFQTNQLGQWHIAIAER
jgi:Tol biopolymer transport system component